MHCSVPKLLMANFGFFLHCLCPTGLFTLLEMIVQETSSALPVEMRNEIFFHWLKMINMGNRSKMDVGDEKIEKVSVYFLSWFPCLKGERKKVNRIKSCTWAFIVNRICTRAIDDASLFLLYWYFSKNMVFF